MGVDPLAVRAARGRGPAPTRRFANTGDLVVIGPYDQATGEVVSYEDLVGSHGGLGGWQGRPFLLHPADLPVDDAPLVGAVAVHAELRRWLGSLRAATPADRGSADLGSDGPTLAETERPAVEPERESVAAAT